jgi:hypothetical protein
MSENPSLALNPFTEAEHVPPMSMADMDLDELQEARLEEFQRKSLGEEDPLQALLGCQAAGMWGLAQRISRELLEEAQSEGNLLDVLENEPRAAATLFQLERQAERYAQLYIRRQGSPGDPIAAGRLQRGQRPR